MNWKRYRLVLLFVLVMPWDSPTLRMGGWFQKVLQVFHLTKSDSHAILVGNTQRKGGIEDDLYKIRRMQSFA